LSILKIPTARIFEPLLKSARYKGAYGGRGSGKSHFFGELIVETCQAERGTSAVCIREAQRTLAQSSRRLIEGKIASLGLGHQFKLYSDKIETPGDGIIIFRGMQSYTFKAVITVIVSGLVGAVWLGAKAMLGKLRASSLCCQRCCCGQPPRTPIHAGSSGALSPSTAKRP